MGYGFMLLNDLINDFVCSRDSKSHGSFMRLLSGVTAFHKIVIRFYHGKNHS